VAGSDFELLDAWGSGDLVAGQALFERYFDVLHRFFRTKLDDGLEDVIQQTWLACVEGRARFRREASFRTFVLQIARYQLYAHYRARTRRELLDPSVSSVADLNSSPSRVLARGEEERMLLEALRKMPLDQQIVIELSFWEELTGPEIAEVLEIPEPTVRSRLRRATERLRNELSALADGSASLEATSDDLQHWARRLRDALAAQ
jgi:RNA polymerase sigma-70 factor (ECF subfamily)